MEKKETKMQALIKSLPAEIQKEAVNAVSFKEILNVPPPKNWLKKHPKGFTYMPFDKLFLIMNILFRKHEISIINYNQIVNSIVVHCRIKLTAYDNSTIIVDGIGAAPIQTAKGAAPMDYDKVISEAVSLAAPAAYTFAIKNALRKIGKIFGSELEADNPVDFATVNPVDLNELLNNLNV